MLELDLIVFLAYLVVTGSAAAAMAHAKATTGWMPKWLKSAVFFAIPAAEMAVKLARFLTHHFGGFAKALDSKVAKFFGQLAHYQFVVGYWSLYWPVGLFHFAEHLYKHSIPTAINARVKPLTKRIDATEAQAKASAGIAHSIPKIAKAHDQVKPVTRIERVAMPHAGEWDWIHEHFGSLKKAIAGVAAAAATEGLLHFPAYPIPWKSHLKGIRARLKRIEYLLGATGAAVLVARAIGGVTGNCVKKGAIGKVARRLCGLSSNALNDLLGLLVDTFFIVNICEAIHLMEQGLGLISGPLKAFTAGADKMFVDCGYTLPGKITVPQLYTATAAQVAAGK